MKIAFPTLVPYWSDGIESLSMEKSLYAQGRPEQVQLHDEFDKPNALQTQWLQFWELTFLKQSLTWYSCIKASSVTKCSATLLMALASYKLG